MEVVGVLRIYARREQKSRERQRKGETFSHKKKKNAQWGFFGTRICLS